MCGLVGIAGDTLGIWKDVFSELLLIDVVRGPHSTGAGFVGRFTEEFQVAKRAGHPFNLFDSNEYEEAMKLAHPQKVMMGHNRFATIGDKTDANAHPFVFKDVMGMHNGTLDKFCIRDLHNGETYGTDSEAIISTINEGSSDKALSVMSGAWALVWYDKRDSKLHFLRNNKRPLHYCYSDDRCTLLWASEPEMLRYVMDRRNRKIFKDEVYHVTQDTQYSWHVPKFCTKKFDSPDQKKVEGKIWPVTVYGGTTHSFTSGGRHTAATSSTTSVTSSRRNNLINFPSRLDPKKFRQPYKDQYGRHINKSEFTRMVRNGCAFCEANDQTWNDFIYVLGAYTGDRTPFACEHCYVQTDQLDLIQYAI